MRSHLLTFPVLGSDWAEREGHRPPRSIFDWLKKTKSSQERDGLDEAAGLECLDTRRISRGEQVKARERGGERELREASRETERRKEGVEKESPGGSSPPSCSIPHAAP